MNCVQLFLTKCHIKFVHGGRFIEIRRIKLSEVLEREVIIFSNKNPLILGQATVFGTIIIHESVFSKYSPNVQEYVFSHEFAHTRQWSKYIILPIMLMLRLGSVMFIFVVVAALIAFLVSWNLTSLATLGFSLIWLIVGVAISCGLSWWIEGGADYYAIRQLRKDRVVAAYQEIRAKGNKAKFSYKVLARSTYPPISITSRIYDLFHSEKK